jgi:exopolysaccharide biosynthesis polyprenyl glycosylphosphotransferase
MAVTDASVPEPAGLTPEAPAPSALFSWLGHRLNGLKLVAHAGRITVVGLSVFVPFAAQRPLTAIGLIMVAIVTGVWLFALRGAFAAWQATVGVGLSAAIGSSTGLVLLAAANAWLPDFQLGPEILLGMAFGVFASTATWEWVLQQTSIGRRSVLIVGTSGLVGDLVDEIGRAGAARFELAGTVDAPRPTAAAGEISCPGGLVELTAVAEAERPDIVVLADEGTYELAVDQLIDVPRAGFRVVGFTSFFEYAFGRVPLQHLTPAWFMGVLHLNQPVYARWAKRTFDLVLASVGVLLALPLFLLLAFVVGRTPGPIIYWQSRIGEGGRRFTMYKLRTMVCDAEEPGRPRWAAEGDERATRVGRLLRRTHLDELPQLWNVLKGDMSIVGPRPERPELIAEIEAAVPFWNRRLLIKPGITGWAQLRCGYAADCASAAEKLSYDLWYVRHRNLAVDVAICVRTVGLLLRSMRPGRTSGHCRTASVLNRVER